MEIIIKLLTTILLSGDIKNIEIHQNIIMELITEVLIRIYKTMIQPF